MDVFWESMGVQSLWQSPVCFDPLGMSEIYIVPQSFLAVSRNSWLYKHLENLGSKAL